MAIDRREAMRLGLGMGAVLLAGTNLLGWRRASAKAFAAFPADGDFEDQSSALQTALNRAAAAGEPLCLSPGIYSTRQLRLRSGTHVVGVGGRTILTCSDPKGLFHIASATNVRIEGLVLDGSDLTLEPEGALLTAVSAENVHISECHIVGASAHGVLLERVSGRISDCEFDRIGKVGILGEGVARLAIVRNRIRGCGLSPISLTAGADCQISANVVGRTNGFAVMQANCTALRTPAFAA